MNLNQIRIFLLGLVVSLALPTLSIADIHDALLEVESAKESTLKKIDHTIPPGEGIIHLVKQEPVAFEMRDSGVLFIDYGRVAFANLELLPGADYEGRLKVRFGEKMLDGSIDQNPPGTVRFSEVEITIDPNSSRVISPPADERNTQQTLKARRKGGPITPPAVLTPTEWGVLTPFRWVEIEGLPEGFDANQLVRRAAFPKHWDEESAAFECSNEMVNRVWELCRYSIKATMFAGVYVDGDRERIPYEADAYLNQLSHYYVDHDPSMARETYDWLMQFPTWPTEWAPHMVFMAYAEWLQNGDKDWLADRYEDLKAKTLVERIGDLGLIESNEKQVDWNDIVDWPPIERDGYIRSKYNTAINAFHYAAITKMAELAEAVGNLEDSESFKKHAEQFKQVFNAELFDEEKQLYRDGRDIDHYSVHANFFPLAFGLVEDKNVEPITKWLKGRGMRCSTYASQYLLEAFFEKGLGQTALELIVAPGDRSWRYMIDSDATITWESWNEVVKTNLDWNHAWGAAPANLLPRYVLGATPIEAGWRRAQIRPVTSGLEYARGVTPTPLGAISIDWSMKDVFEMKLDLPAGMRASIQVPKVPGAKGVYVNDQLVEAELEEGYWTLKEDRTGKMLIQVK